jgi:hypothetical protein
MNQNFLSKISAVCKSCYVTDFDLDNLSWLPSYMANSKDDLEPYLNTILVFARARTSTLQGLYSWEKLEDFARRLNMAADSSGASHHRIELVRRGPMTFFVTCSNSPRFNWNISLTHCDVGRNLDYFAPGHILDPKQRNPDTEYRVHFIEKNSFEEMTGEFVLLEYMKDEETWDELRRFNQVREKLFNSAMEGLGLDYRFKCVIVSPGLENSIREVMTNPVPPSPSWWEDNCFWANGFGFRNLTTNIELTFCGFESKYQAYWPLLQLAFNFIMKFKRGDYIKKYKGSIEPVARVLSRIKNMTEGDPAPEALDKLLIQITQDLEKAVKIFESGSNLSTSSHHPKVVFLSCRRRLLHRAEYKLLLAKYFVYLHLFEQYKLKNRLVHQGIGCPVSGDVDAFEHWKI